MKDIAIYGAGGFGRETACLLREINEVSPTWNFVGFFDDGVPAGTRTNQGAVLGGIDVLNSWKGELSVVFSIAAPKVLEALSKKIENPNVVFPNIFAPTARILERSSLKIGRGNLINFACTISCDVEIGDFNLLNERVTVGHDTRIGNFNTFMPGAHISGNVLMGDRNAVGMNSAIMQGTKIGNDTKIGASSLIVRDPESGGSYVGVPAVRLEF